jgi:hypothetical protein
MIRKIIPMQQPFDDQFFDDFNQKGGFFAPETFGNFGAGEPLVRLRKQRQYRVPRLVEGAMFVNRHKQFFRESIDTVLILT